MKTFDWEYHKKHAQPKRHEWLKANYNKPISQDDYIAAMIPLKATQTGKIKNNNYSPHKLKNQYRNLKQKFGFFVA